MTPAKALSANIGDGTESFDSLADIQRAVRSRVSGKRSSAAWYRKRHSTGADILDANGKTVARVSYNGRIWQPTEQRVEIVL